MADVFVACEVKGEVDLLRRVLFMLRNVFGPISVSPTYRQTNDYNNTLLAVAKLTSVLHISDLVGDLSKLENYLNSGRVPKAIELNLLSLGDRIINDGPYRVPHPELSQHPGWLAGLAALDGTQLHPEIGADYNTLSQEHPPVAYTLNAGPMFLS